MTDPLITVSPKSSSTYRSQIHTRLASAGSSSSSLSLSTATSRSRSVDPYPSSQEKLQLKKLNDKFLSYIERVRLFETYNHCLTVHSDQLKTAQQRTQEKFDVLKQEFEDYQQERLQREKKDIQLENHHTSQIEHQVDDAKTKQTILQNEHDRYRKQVIDLQRQCVEIQGKTEQLRYDHENVTEDHHHYRRQVSCYQAFKSSILDEISRQRDFNQRTQIEVEELKVQKQIAIQAHEADTQALQIHHDNVLYDLTTNFRFDGHGKDVLTEMLNEIREEYKQKDQEMRDELHRKYLYEYNQHMKKNFDQNFLDNNREDLDRRHLSNELNSLNDNRILLRQKLALLQEHSKQLEMNIDREMRRKHDLQEKYDEQIYHLRSSIQDYEHLLRDSTAIRSQTLQDEVNKYRQLLEGSDHHKGLRQLVQMTPKVDQYSSTYRPMTPPPSSSNSQSPSTSAHYLLRPVLTRQNSNSEVSFDTAPVLSAAATSTTTTNQPYVTLNSIVNPPMPPDNYDTDNDQSQTIHYASGRNSRLMSETEILPTSIPSIHQDLLPPTEFLNNSESIVEVPINLSHHEVLVNETLPFTPMISVSQPEIDIKKDTITEEQQSPLISTVEQRQEENNLPTESIILPSTETIIPITIDINSKPIEEHLVIKTISPLTPMMAVPDQTKPSLSPILASKPTEGESELVKNLSDANHLAKLISNMLPNVVPFVPSNNFSNNRPVSPTPSASIMNNDAPPFIPNQHQNNQMPHQMGNNNPGHWNGRGSGGGNRRGQTGGFHHGGGGNQRLGGGGGNWQSGGGGHNKQRRGPK